MKNEQLLYVVLGAVVIFGLVYMLMSRRRSVSNSGSLSGGLNQPTNRTLYSNTDSNADGNADLTANSTSNDEWVSSGNTLQTRNNGVNVGQTVEGLSSMCGPQEQLRAEELLPMNNSSEWATCMGKDGKGALQGQNFLEADRFIGISSVGQTLRNANLQLRSEPPNPQVVVSPWLNTTIQPDVSRRYFEVGQC